MRHTGRTAATNSFLKEELSIRGVSYSFIITLLVNVKMEESLRVLLRMNNGMKLSALDSLRYLDKISYLNVLFESMMNSKSNRRILYMCF